MLLSNAIKKKYPNLTNPDLTRRKSKSHWRGKRKKTRRERAATILAKSKRSTISRRLVHRKEDFPLLCISDGDLDINIMKEHDTVDIEISDAELLIYDIEITGRCSEEHLIDLLDRLIDRVAANLLKKKEIHV